MDATDWIMVLIGGLVGWGLVSLAGHLIRQQRQPPVDLYGGLPAAAGSVRRETLTLAEIATAWHKILGVPEEASAREIEEAYHRRIVECDRIRFSPTEPEDARKTAQVARSRVAQAYEFIRPLRSE